jgi:hypothetical protein
MPALTHGHSRSGNRTPEWTAWQNMIRRCTDTNFRQYDDYGGRGITVAAEWRGPGGFERFLAAVGPRPSTEYTLDRKENDLGYAPGNVRWATRVTQNNNTSKNVFLTASGQTLTIAQWCKISGLKHNTVRGRLTAGWSPEKAVSEPALPRGRSARTTPVPTVCPCGNIFMRSTSKTAPRHCSVRCGRRFGKQSGLQQK